MRRLWRAIFGPLGAISGAVLLPAGFLGGVLFWGGFNWAMEATNTNAFCISCHEMRDTVYEEYKTTAHYANASGVRAGCADCHVPQPWLRKVARKIYATNELYHWAVGTIDTPEKFEAHRAVMAERVWAAMEANDSAECRNCHAYEAMAFPHQSTDASAQMRQAFAEGETCIACHKGVAHDLPDRFKGHEALYADLVAMGRRLDHAAAVVRTFRSEPLHASADHAEHGGPPVGRLQPGVSLEVLGRDGEALRVRLEGWREDGVDDAIHALMGKRILSATLSPDATELVARHETARDDDGLAWRRVSADLWIRPGGVVADDEKVWTYGAALNTAACSGCHVLAEPEQHRADQWIAILQRMERFSKLDDEQIRVLRAYLKRHAADVPARGAEREARDLPTRGDARRDG